MYLSDRITGRREEVDYVTVYHPNYSEPCRDTKLDERIIQEQNKSLQSKLKTKLKNHDSLMKE